MRHMIQTGNELRKIREELGISQARLAEITGLPQHILSSFELEKTALGPDVLNEINDLVPNISNYESVLKRKKRYRQHTYSDIAIDPDRASRARKTAENQNYLEALRDLEQQPEPNFTAVSFFAGIGGFSLGFRSCGFDIKGFVEIDDDLASIYQANFPNTRRLGSDITRITDEEFESFRQHVGDIDVVIGGPPCQGFSLSGKRDVDDPRNYLFQDYLRAIDLLRPKFAIIENVRLLTSMKSKEGGFVKDAIRDGLRSHGYSSALYEVNAKDYGVPQHRERAIFIAVRDDLGVKPTMPEAAFSGDDSLFTHNRNCRTFGDACSDLPYLESGHAAADPYHKAVKHPEHVLQWLWDVPEGRSAHDNEDPELRPPSGYNTTYKRQIWDEPASTVQTTFGMISGCRNVHPIATRSLTVREASRLQSFPDSYKFVGSLGTIRTGIGNAVPPLLARSLARHLSSQLADLVKVSSF